MSNEVRVLKHTVQPNSRKAKHILEKKFTPEKLNPCLLCVHGMRKLLIPCLVSNTHIPK